MMSFYRKSVQSFRRCSEAEPTEDGDRTPCKYGLGIIASYPDDNSIHRGRNVLESSLLKPPPPPLPAPPSAPPPKRDPGGLGFLDAVVDGLTSCTESLGSESCDDRRADDDHDHDHDHFRDQDGHDDNMINVAEKRRVSAPNRRSNGRRETDKKFPPPISSLNSRGQPCFFFRAVRMDGRLELRRVKIQRPEILRASRLNGRLRLRFVTENYNPMRGSQQSVQEQEQEHQEQECHDDHHHHDVGYGDDDGDVNQEPKDQEQECQELDDDDDDYVQVDEDSDENQEQECQESSDDDAWRYRRCHELVMSSNYHDHDHHHHHHHIPLWSRRCVTTS